MKRATLLLLLGVAVSFSGHWLTEKLVPFESYTYEDYLMVISHIEMFGVFPAVPNGATQL